MAKSKKPAPKEKVVVKKKGGCLVIFIILLLLALLAFLLGLHFGWWGKGDGDGDGDGDGKSKTSGTSTTEVDKSAQKDEYVTVSGAKYMYNNNSVEIEELVNKLAEIEGNVLVHISDDNATDSAMTELKKALDNANPKIRYVEETEAASEASTEASTEK